MSEEKKIIKINWETPNGKQYADKVPMTLQQYESFVQNLLGMKNQ